MEINQSTENLQTQITNDIINVINDMNLRCKIIWDNINQTANRVEEVNTELDQLILKRMEDLSGSIEKGIGRLDQIVNGKIIPQLSEINLRIDNKNDDI